MSHAVSLSSPSSFSSSSSSSPTTLAEHHLLISRPSCTCRRMSFHPRARRSIWQRRQTTTFSKAAALANVALPCFLKLAAFSFFSFLTSSFAFIVHKPWIQMDLVKAPMEYDTLIIFPRPWQIALTAYNTCFLTFVLFVSVPRWLLNLGRVENGR